MLYYPPACYEIATGGISSLIEAPHRLLQSDLRRIEIGAGLRDVLMPEHGAHRVQRPASLKQPRARLMPQIMEGEVDARERLARGRCERRAAGVFRLVPMRFEETAFPCALDIGDLPANAIAEDVILRAEALAGEVGLRHLQNAKQPLRYREDAPDAGLARALLFGADRKLAALEADIAPLQRKQFAAPRRRFERRDNQPLQLLVGMREQFDFLLRL